MKGEGVNKKNFEDISELCRVALEHYINMHTKKKFKSRLFVKLNEKYKKIPFSNLTNFIEKKASLSEKKRIQISSFLGFKYEEFIALGRKVVSLKKNNTIQAEIREEDFYLNLATAKIFQEFQKKYSLSDRMVANCLNIDMIEYGCKKIDSAELF